MKTRLIVVLLTVFVSIFSLVSPVQADGIIIPNPCPGGLCPPLPPCDPGLCPHPMTQLVIRYHRVNVKIQNQVAITHVDQVFYNPNDYSVEGTYIFPLPLDAAVTQFILWVDGKPVEGKILDAVQARQTYEQIVRDLRDPALLEYIGRGAVQASIFPIQPDTERRIELEYTQVLTAENGLVRYIYPLNTEKFSAQPLEQVSVRVEINDRQSIRAIYSPSHNLDINRADQNNAIATYEASQVLPDKDFSLFFSVGETNAFHLMSYRDSADPQDSDGFFLLLLAPPPLTSDQQVAKDILLVLDRSGSMEGEKFSQAQSALKYILNHLNLEDRFYLMAFSSDLQTYSNSLSPANKADDAIGWVNQLGSAGSTDINRALLETAAVVDDKRPTYLIFLTDGLPTEGVTDSQEILKNFSQSAPNNLRLFPFGVGYDVDTILLDTLSSEQHGLSTYVQPGQNLDEALSSFYARISTPVLTNLSLDFDSLGVYDIYPNPLPDLFAGSQVIVVGRYRKGGMTDVILKGDINGTLKNQEYPQQYFDVDSRVSNSILSEIPRLWATRKIGYLLNKIRLQGADQETIDQIVRLSIRYGIITPYTSYLVTEPMPLGVENQERLSQQTYQDYQAQPTMASGEGAVNKAAEQGAMSQAEVAPPSSELSQQKVKTVGSRTFVLSDGSWIDTAFDSTTMQTQKIAFLSTEYFTLAQSRADVSAALALGEQVILLVDGNAYEIVAEGSVTDNVPLPPTETPSALQTSTTHTTNTPTPSSRPTSNNTSQALPSTDQPGCAAGILPMFGILAFFSVKGLKKHNPH